LRRLKLLGVLVLVLFILLILLPALIVRGCDGPAPPKVEVEPYHVKVWDHRAEELVEMPLSQYLLGVVAAEMPADFHIEALKAQAIVARTYTITRLRQHGGQGCDQNPHADICTDSTHCQAWVSQEEAMAKWPFFRQNANWSKIQRAVADTQGQVVTHEGNFIDAVYHSTCGGTTENSEDVYTNMIPYLRAVPCGYCTHSPRITETVRLSVQDVADKLGEDYEDLKLDILDKTESGRIISIDVGSQILRGLEFRTRLDLKSSKISILEERDVISFTTTGYGHAVGMCQYGADGMARQGYSAEEILAHYYTGIQVQRVKLEE